MVATYSCPIRNLLMVELEARNLVLDDGGGQACSPDGGREGLWQLGMDNAVLAPLVFLHGLLPEELLVTDVALERTVVAVGTLVDLTQNNSFKCSVHWISRGSYFPNNSRLPLLGQFMKLNLKEMF